MQIVKQQKSLERKCEIEEYWKDIMFWVRKIKMYSVSLGTGERLARYNRDNMKILLFLLKLRGIKSLAGSCDLSGCFQIPYP